MKLSVSTYDQIIPLKDGIVVTERKGHQVIEGSLSAHIIAAIRAGAETREAVAARLVDHKETEIFVVIDLMIRDGIIEVFERHVRRSTLKRWQRLPLQKREIENALDVRGIRLWGESKFGAMIQRNLGIWGMQLGGDALTIVHANSLTDPRITSIADQLFEEQAYWMLVCPQSLQMAFFSPGQETPCWRCLCSALRRNQPAHLNYESSYESTEAPLAVEQSAFLEAVSEAALTWLVRMTHPGLEGYLWEQNGLHEEFDIHRILHQHDCELGCGKDLFKLAKDYKQLKSNLPGILRATGDRIEKEDSYASQHHLISRLTGILRNPVVLPEVDARIGYTSVVQHNMARPSMRIDKLRVNAFGYSIGKGKNIEAAKKSALFEGIERFSGVWRDDIKLIWGTEASLGAEAVDVEYMLGYSRHQLENRLEWNAENPYPMLQVPRPYLSAEEKGWVEGISLTNGRRVLVPAGYCFYDYSTRDGFLCDSNGCAAGQEAQDAIFSGLLEILERDAIGIWWYNRLARPGILLSSFPDSWIQMQVRVHADMGRSLQVIDLTNDFQVPVVAAISRKLEGAPEWVIGFGCDRDIQKAITGALLELGQVFTVRWNNPNPARLFNKPIPDNATWLAPNPNEAVRTMKDYAVAMPTIEDVVKHIDDLGHEVIAVDQTHPSLGVPVFRTIIPGLCHHWPRLAVKRLYEIPFQLGWLDHRNSEASLNPSFLML